MLVTLTIAKETHSTRPAREVVVLRWVGTAACAAGVVAAMVGELKANDDLFMAGVIAGACGVFGLLGARLTR
jgi:hypothetical protein